MTKEDKEILNTCKALAKRECANYLDGHCLETDTPCHERLINTAYCSVSDGTLDCDWFFVVVLPLDEALNHTVRKALFVERSLYDEDDDDDERTFLKQCERCGKFFTPHSNRQKRCKACSIIAQTAANRDSHHRRYWKDR